MPNFDKRSSLLDTILLCVHCHRYINLSLAPGNAFVPADLAYFIEKENIDMRARRKAHESAKIWRRRIIPTIENHAEHCQVSDKARGGLYTSYYFKIYFAQNGNPPKLCRPSAPKQ